MSLRQPRVHELKSIQRRRWQSAVSEKPLQRRDKNVSSWPVTAMRFGLDSADAVNLCMFAFLGPAYLISVGYMDPGNWATDIEGVPNSIMS